MSTRLIWPQLQASSGPSPQVAIAALSALMQDQEASGVLRARLAQVITALGGTLPETAGG